MNRKTIVLADNSYTIRRIVELSFSEEEEIELISFEDGANLREKLLEVKPEIVLVDIKLPEFSGYEVCKFINTTESLKQTKVFLLKGGFEPIDESLLTNLKYASIITKPFDSNALVATIKKLLAAPAKRAPSSVPGLTPSFEPEDIPVVDGLSEPESEISFSDVKDDIGSDGILSGNVTPGSMQYLPSDDVLPSEEITQGTQPDVDTLAPSREEDMDNPFAEEEPVKKSIQKTLSEEELDIKMNIQLQEKELEIDSLTQEEIRIKKHIDNRKVSSPDDQFAGIGQRRLEEPLEFEDLELDIPSPDSGAEFDEDELEPPIEIPHGPGSLEQKKPGYPSPIDDFLPSKKTEYPGTPKMEKYPEIAKTLEEDNIDFERELKSEQYMMDDTSSVSEQEDFSGFEPQEDIREAPAPKKTMFEKETLQNSGLAKEMKFEMPMMDKPAVHEKEKIKKVPAEPGIPGKTPTAPSREDFDIPPASQPRASQKEVMETPSIQKEELLYKVEDKLTLAIKEILWDVVPHMAEKIIKSEIEKLKTEVDKSFEYIEK